MKKKKKIALYAASGLLATSLAVGGATYALFKGEATNASNSVTAGELEITAKRNDVPNVGPMFYSHNVTGNYGGMPTGFWAPGDKHTRGLFLENTGSLEAKLTTLTAKPADSNGNAITSGTQYDDDLLFARQAKVKIWDIQEFDPLKGAGEPFGIDSNMTANEMDFIMDVVNVGYDMWLADHPNADLSDQTNAVDLLNTVNEYMFAEISKRSGTTDNRLFKVVKMYDKNLSEFVNNSYDASSFGIKLEPGKAALLGFTVEFKKRPGGNIDRNSMQGKSVYFNFGTDWVQTKNN